MTITSIIAASFVIMTASLIGTVFISKLFSKKIENNMGLLVSFSAGVFLVVVILLGSEVFHLTENPSSGLLWIIGGLLGITVLLKFLPGFHHHHEKHDHHEKCHLDSRKIVFSDAIHNIGDGILIATSFTIGVPVGIAATLSIFIHEVIQEISEFFVLRQSGFSVKKALLTNFLVSSTILIGSIGGFFLLETFSQLEMPLLAIATGSFLAVVIQDLIPESIRLSNKKKSYAKYIIAFIVGAVLMIFVNSVTLGHGHGSDHDHESGQHDEH